MSRTTKVVDLRPCDNCRGKIAPHFYILRVSLALVNYRAINSLMAMNQFFEGKSPALAELFSPGSDELIKVAGEENPRLWTELWLCQDCYMLKDLSLPELTEKRSKQIEAKRDKAAEEDEAGLANDA